MAGLTAHEYERQAMRTCVDGVSERENLAIAALGLTSEAGEVANLVRKHIEQGHPYDEAMRAKLIDEVGDVAWYVARMCRALGISLDEVLAANIAKLQRRYPDGFSVERSLHREVPVTVSMAKWDTREVW